MRLTGRLFGFSNEGTWTCALPLLGKDPMDTKSKSSTTLLKSGDVTSVMVFTATRISMLSPAPPPAQLKLTLCKPCNAAGTDISCNGTTESSNVRLTSLYPKVAANSSLNAAVVEAVGSKDVLPTKRKVIS